MNMWRWDQGRLLYFQFDVLKSIASVLVGFDGMDIRQCEPLFRQSLTNSTGMPFAPEHYTVLRNYKRFLSVLSWPLLLTLHVNCQSLMGLSAMQTISC
jgi:hypothetical protein